MFDKPEAVATVQRWVAKAENDLFAAAGLLTALMELLPSADRPDLSADEQDRMTRYVTITRYPGDYDPPTLSEARNAVKIARRIRRQIRKRLPKEVLRSSN